MPLLSPSQDCSSDSQPGQVFNESVCVYVRTYVRMYICMYGWLDVCMYGWMYVWMDGCMYGCMYVWMYGCTSLAEHHLPAFQSSTSMQPTTGFSTCSIGNCKGRKKKLQSFRVREKSLPWLALHVHATYVAGRT